MTKVFTTKTCAYCPAVKKYLDSLKHEYKLVDCTENIDKFKEVADKTGAYTFPQTLFDDGMAVVGLNYSKLKEGVERNGRN